MVNKQHPDYKKYVDECYSARKTLDKKLSEVKQPNVMCKDGPNEKIYKEFAKEIKSIQEKYSYLFTD